ncbi:hypothetical protein BABINDRAFT_167004 [Babjeviella inositovora NRRL Y-12698]|uniref:F-box domain-containing protein n=1 Tax=Babjeviella inositovora NRRL Y-12698 TaxID=984486 RepID=A0A1E3QQC6_9ASCO|nr:uncharacterized protein BABINDRAFT_167004 [Babjeviella inositovora NRRL Y-12698]ODQ79899.1 hypothetical protein BABINDRAFT_167004 [Babjeviella inositovora NRRL Y-12698]
MGLLTKNSKSLKFRKVDSNPRREHSNKNTNESSNRVPTTINSGNDSVLCHKTALNSSRQIRVIKPPQPQASIFEKLPVEILYHIQFKHNLDYDLLNLVMVNKRVFRALSVPPSEASHPSGLLKAFIHKFIHNLNQGLSLENLAVLDRFKAETTKRECVLDMAWKAQKQQLEGGNPEITLDQLQTCCRYLTSTKCLDRHVFNYRMCSSNSHDRYRFLQQVLETQAIKLVLPSVEAVRLEQKVRTELAMLLTVAYNELDSIKDEPILTVESSVDAAEQVFNQEQAQVSNMDEFLLYQHQNRHIHEAQPLTNPPSVKNLYIGDLPHLFQVMELSPKTIDKKLFYLNYLLQETNLRIANVNDFLIGILTLNLSVSENALLRFVSRLIGVYNKSQSLEEANGDIRLNLIPVLIHAYSQDQLVLFEHLLVNHLRPDLIHNDRLWNSVIEPVEEDGTAEAERKTKMKAFVNCLLEHGGKPSSQVLRLMTLSRSR